MHFVCSNVSVLVLPSVSHLSFISALILDSYVPHDRNVYESQQNLGQELLVRPVWALSGLLQSVLMWCLYCGLFSSEKLFCMYWTLTLGYPLAIYLMSSWSLCSFPI